MRNIKNIFMKISSLNQQHEDILHEYVKFVQGTVYRATENQESSKFLDFNEVLENIIDYTNAFNKLVKTPNIMTEWAYMTPNLILYACMGFLTGIKNTENAEEIEFLSEELLEKTVDFIGHTTDILEDIKIKEAFQKKTLTKHQNEHNN